jgi:hypothetical protein
LRTDPEGRNVERKSAPSAALILQEGSHEQMVRPMKRITATVLAVAFAATPAAALADSGTAGVRSAADAVYAGPGLLGDEPADHNASSPVSDQGGTPTSAGANVTSLPFTGYAAGAVLVLGAGMLAFGAVGRRLTRRHE